MTLAYALRLAAIGTVAVCVSQPVLSAPRGSGGRAAHSGGHGGNHAHHGSRHSGSARHFAPRARFYGGVPFYVAATYYGPSHAYPPVYLAPGPDVHYFCPTYGDYYPRVPVCPLGWEPVVQPPGPYAPHPFTPGPY